MPTETATVRLSNVTSDDGTEIAYHSLGKGPSLVVLGGFSARAWTIYPWRSGSAPTSRSTSWNAGDVLAVVSNAPITPSTQNALT
jgi:hypothetical protein